MPRRRRYIRPDWADEFEAAGHEIPQCKRLITLSINHKIADDGTVTPSCVCPTSYCQYHANVKLQDWKPKGVQDVRAKQG